jgi:ATPase subunit of ABC transporter with duplicated ATPase domains
MSLLTVSQLDKGFGAQRVLDGVNLRVARGEKIGIVGKNGGGKTTLLRLLLGRELPDRGSVRAARGVRIGYLAQIADLDETRTVREEAETSLHSLLDAEAELRETEALLAASPDDEDALDAYGAARDRFEFAGGERARDNLFGALAAMGFDKPGDLDKPIAVLSGGEKTRLAMAKLLASAPDVLALDEPTNHLDIRAVEWLEAFLQRFPGAVLVVSHDRRLLASGRADRVGGRGVPRQRVRRRLRGLPGAAGGRPAPAAGRVRAPAGRDREAGSVRPQEQGRPARRGKARGPRKGAGADGADRAAGERRRAR